MVWVGESSAGGFRNLPWAACLSPLSRAHLAAPTNFSLVSCYPRPWRIRAPEVCGVTGWSDLQLFGEVRRFQSETGGLSPPTI